MRSLAVANLPGLRPIPLFGPSLALVRLLVDPLRTLPRLHAEYGEIAATCRGNASVVCVFGPTYNQQLLPRAKLFEVSDEIPIPTPEGSAFARISDNLSSMNGADHRRLRRLMMPAFSKSAVQGYRDTMVDIISARLERWRPGEQLDLCQAMHELTLDIMSVCLFDVAVEADAGDEGLAKLAAVFLRSMTSLSTVLLPVDLPFTPFGRHLRRCEELERRMLAQLEQRQREGVAGRKDALSLLLGGGELDAPSKDAGEGEQGEAPLEQGEVISNMVLLFLAGYETTANALCAALMLLAQHPEICVELRAELDAKLGGAAPTIGELAELPLLDRVVNESLRILPPAYITFLRRSTAPVELGPYTIPAGATLVLSPLVTHHMPEVWSQPQRFDPHRWRTRKPTPYEFMPFGGGPRRCLGATFSELEIRLTLALLVQRFAFQLRPGQRVDYQARGIVMGPAGAVQAELLEVGAQPRAGVELGGSVREWVGS